MDEDSWVLRKHPTISLRDIAGIPVDILGHSKKMLYSDSMLTPKNPKDYL